MATTINCDMGEGYGLYTLGNDVEFMPFVTHANIACGFHASDPSIMWKTVKDALSLGVQVGSHPGLADREGFGRREMTISRAEVAASVLYQTGALQAFLTKEGGSLSYIKAHGALFGMAQKNEDIAHGIADAAEALQVPTIGFANCALSRVFEERKIPFACEFYADLDYDDEGKQIITRVHKPVNVAEAVNKVIKAIDKGTTTSVSGKEVSVVADTICVHSDTPNGLEVARAVHKALESRLTVNLV